MEQMLSTPEIKPILVPIDFSIHSQAALIFAINLAELMHRPIIVMHVVHDPASAPGYYRSDSNNDIKTMDSIAEDMMESFLKEVKESNPEINMDNIETKLLDGNPAKRIIEYAQIIDAYMIVMGSHGQGPKSFLIASKAKKVTEAAPMPVTMVKAAEEVTNNIEGETT